MGYLQMPEPSTPQVIGLPLPTLLLLGGVVLGVVLAVLCRFLVGLTARRRARVADQRLREAVRVVSQELVIAPVEAELQAYTTVRNGLSKALK
jgi:hypothetical protein